MTPWRGLALVAALIAAQSALAGQPEPADTAADEAATLRTSRSQQEIVVTGQRELDKEVVRDALRDIAMRGRRPLEPLARYQDPLCLAVLGLGEELGARVAARIEDHTRRVDFSVGEPGCTHNAIVILTNDPERLVERIRDERRGLVTVRSMQRIKSALRREYPAITWSVTEARGPRGTDLSIGAPAIGAALGSNAGANFAFTDSVFASKFMPTYSLARLMTFVVFDAGKLDGVHVDQLADYATMRILGDPQPRAALGADQPDTILDLFRKGPFDASPGLTLMDLAYLRGLYAMRPNEPSTRLESFTIEAYRDLAALGCEDTGTCEVERDPG